ncbi:hypothetical protein ACC696_38420, partial [Rhizobium ruizarguesonis]
GSMDDVLKAVIAVDGAKVSFGAVRSLYGVTLRVMPGECVGLVGHNGACKSTIVSVDAITLQPFAVARHASLVRRETAIDHAD